MREALEPLTDGLKHGINTVHAPVKEFVENAADYIYEDLGDDIVDTFEDVGDAIVDVAEDVADTVVEVAEKIFNPSSWF